MRSTRVTRNTLETQISIELNLDGTGKARFDTGLPFLDHMLDQVARHGESFLPRASRPAPAHRHSRH